MRDYRLLTLLAILAFAFSSCDHQVTKYDAAGDTLRLSYAENLTIVRYTDHVAVTLKDPWNKGRVLRKYVLVGDSVGMGRSVRGDDDATVVRVPLRRSVVFNTAHASLLCMFDSIGGLKHDAVGAIAGVADFKYMQLPEIHRRVGNGHTADCGDAMSPDIERIVDLQADAILLSPFENSGGYGRLEEIGIPIIECAEYMETSALGRAEWMLFYGILYGCYDTAAKLFAEVERQYQSLSERAKSLPEKRSILTEKLTGQTWYVAGGRSSVGRLIADAGGAYAWSGDTHSGSLALSFETVLDRAGDADVWLFNDVSGRITYQRLLAEYHGYSQLRAFRQRNVWYVNSLRVPYFEEVSFCPDRLLRDYIILLHPGLSDLGKPKYFRRIEK